MTDRFRLNLSSRPSVPSKPTNLATPMQAKLHLQISSALSRHYSKTLYQRKGNVPILAAAPRPQHLLQYRRAYQSAQRRWKAPPSCPSTSPNPSTPINGPARSALASIQSSSWLVMPVVSRDRRVRMDEDSGRRHPRKDSRREGDVSQQYLRRSRRRRWAGIVEGVVRLWSIGGGRVVLVGV